jgi:hydroxyethylthiazole kinase
MPIEVADAQPLAGLAASAADSLNRIRRDEPRVHCLTNTVAQSLTANLLLSVGASPAMSLALDEIDQLVAGSAALVINLGTLDEARRAAMSRAVRVAAEHRIPWVLDPVMVERSPARLSFARELLAQRPTVVRGNAPEITALGRDADPGGLAKDIGTVVAQTGPVDVVCDASRSHSLSFGHPLMTRVTGLGCALSALLAAFCAVESDPFAAAAQGLLAFGVAGEMAGETAAGPGSFQTALLDRLYTLDAAALTARGRSQ